MHTLEYTHRHTWTHQQIHTHTHTHTHTVTHTHKQIDCRINLQESGTALLLHTCLPRNCIFRNKNHQNSEHSIIFRNASANVSQHLRNKSSYQILWENHGAIYIVHLPYQFCTAENAVCQSCCLTVCQSNHFTTVLLTSEFKQVSPFS